MSKEDLESVEKNFLAESASDSKVSVVFDGSFYYFLITQLVFKAKTFYLGV